MSVSETTGVMIDGPDTVDRDDALFVRRTKRGWQATVHVAGIADLVLPGDAADAGALRRVRSRYLPDKTLRMLPAATERRASLSPGRPASTLRASLVFDDSGELLDVTVSPGRLARSVALSYQEATSGIFAPSHPSHELLASAHDLARLLLVRRKAGGALAVYDISHGWATDEEGNIVVLSASESNAAYVVVQELMIAANAAIALWCADRELPILFRNHRISAVAPPREELLDDLTAVEADPIGGRLDVLRRRLALVQKPAVYEAHVAGHFGLNLPAYTHATSPLRRYPDLVNQRILLAAAGGSPSPYSSDELSVLAATINEKLTEWRENRAERLRSAAKAETRKQLLAGAYRGLDADGFHRVVKVAVTEQKPPTVFVEEVRHRRESGAFTPRDACQLLFFTPAAGDSDSTGPGTTGPGATGPGATGPDSTAPAAGDPDSTASTGWEPLREQVLHWLRDEPAHAITVVTMYAAIGQLDPIEWSMTEDALPSGPTFTAVASLEGKESPGRTATAKREARQQAALGLIAALTGLPDPSHDLLPAEGSPAPPEAGNAMPELPPGQHPVMSVNQLMQLGLLTEVDWSFESSGPPHEPVHSCTVTAFFTPAGEALSATGTANAKATAKTSAAEALLAQLS